MKNTSRTLPAFLLIAVVIVIAGVRLAFATESVNNINEIPFICTDNVESESCVTPTPTNTPEETITPTPTCDQGSTCFKVDCDGEGECELAIGGTPTPTATPTSTPTPKVTATPTPGPNATPTPGPSNNSNNSSNSQPPKTVLGTTTMAKTGVFEDTLMNALSLIGMVSLSVGSLTYAKSKKA